MFSMPSIRRECSKRYILNFIFFNLLISTFDLYQIITA